MRRLPAILALLAGLLGAFGVGGAAAAAHGAFPPNLLTASTFMLFHAGPVLAISRFAGNSRLWLACGALLAVGALLFGGELAIGALIGASPLPLAAPTGGWAMILGWLGVSAAGCHELLARK